MQQKPAPVKFETLKSEEIKFGKDKFLEIARKKAITSEGENTFISLSKGFVTKTGEKRYDKSFAIPVDEKVVQFITEKLKDFLK